MAAMTGSLNRSINPQLSLWQDSARGKPGELAPVLRRNGHEVELVQLLWGLEPRNSQTRPAINIRSEGRHFPTHRCLLPSREFTLRDASHARWRFSLPEDEMFYLAGVWRPSSETWPEAFAILTIAANPDVVAVHDRQMAVITGARCQAWLDHTAAEEELLRPLPAGTFRAERAASRGS